MKRFALLLSVVVAALVFAPTGAYAKDKHKHHHHDHDGDRHHHHDDGRWDGGRGYYYGRGGDCGRSYYGRSYYQPSYYQPNYYAPAYYAPYGGYSNGYCLPHRHSGVRIVFGF